MRIANWRLLLLLTVGMAFGATHDCAADETSILLDDDFSAYRPGQFFSVVGPHTEYHYLPDAAPKGNWVVSTFRSDSDSQRAWRVIEVDGEPAMQQAWINQYVHCHPMLLTGDPAWSDYTVDVEFTPESSDKQSGIAFRYDNDRCYYFFGVDGPRAVLKMVRHATAFRKPYEKVLAEAPCNWSPGERLTATISVSGKSIHVKLVPDIEFEVEDETYPVGKVALTADIPTVYHHVAVTTDASTKAGIDRAIAEREQEEISLQSANPKLVVWRKIKTDGFGVGRNLRFGDLDGDGQIDVLIGQVHNLGPADRNSEVGCLTAMTLDGKQLWQIGEPDPWANHLTCDVGFQIHDLDGDGRNEVVYAKQMQIVVADGATGKTRQKVPTPETPPLAKPPYNRLPRILGDAIYFCDLRGTGRDADVIIKDRYQCLWALNDKLEVMWQAQCNTGHYPYAEDIDGDGHDELMVGYTLFDDDGTPLWSLDGEIQDHADGVALVRFLPGGPFRLLCAASDEGMFFADMAGNMLKHHYLGHVQNPVIADFRPDLPGLEAVSINFWGNQGIIHFYDANGDIYHDCEPVQLSLIHI